MARREPRSTFIREDREREQTKLDKIDIENEERKRDIQPSTQPSSKTEASNYIGFANLPNQVYRRSVKQGFEFSLMVVGESGLGKSTLINSMFLTDVYNNEHPGPSFRIKKTVSVDATTVMLKENGVQLRLTVVDTPGFGDAVDNSNCWQPVTEYIEKKYEDYLNAETQLMRKTIADNRVHCCLYFIAPNGHSLKPLDIEFMRRLHDKVNIVPLIAKCDTLTADECREFKKTVLNELAQNKIKIYEFPDGDEEDGTGKNRKKVKDRVPFAVVGSNTFIDVGGKKVRGRAYPWGVVEVENMEHSDFVSLRNMLLRSHMQDLKDVTNFVHYENYRYNKLASLSPDGQQKATSAAGNPLTQLEADRQDHLARLRKMEAEMEQVFNQKVSDKKQKLRDSEADLNKRAEQMKINLEQQEQQMDEKRKLLDKEIAIWEEQNHDEKKDSLEQKKKKGMF